MITFTSGTGSAANADVLGSTVPALYLANNPASAEIPSLSAFWLLPILLSVIGIAISAMGVAGSIIFFRDYRRQQLRPANPAADQAWLRAHGTRILTDFQGITKDDDHKRRGQSTYRIVTGWEDRRTGAAHRFQSDDLPFDPAQFIPRQGIAAYVDPDDIERYDMDTSFLPSHRA